MADEEERVENGGGTERERERESERTKRSFGVKESGKKTKRVRDEWIIGWLKTKVPFLFKRKEKPNSFIHLPIWGFFFFSFFNRKLEKI